MSANDIAEAIGTAMAKRGGAVAPVPAPREPQTLHEALTRHYRPTPKDIPDDAA